jgi:beta-lactam-binding protein with PASTA domain
VTNDPKGKPDDAGKIAEQGTPQGALVPAGTDVDVKIAGPVCTVPGLVGLTEDDARAAVEAQGCTLRTGQQATANPAEVGKVTAQNPGANLHVPKGSPVDATLGVQVLGETATRNQTAKTGGGAAPALARTGGVAFGSLALWLLLSGLLTRTAGSSRLWQLVRRRRG